MKNNYKIYIRGISGSGKTFLSKSLSKKLKIKRYGLDEIVFGKKTWNKRVQDKKRDAVIKKIIKKSGLKNSARVKAIDQSRVVDAPLHLFIEELTEICVTLHLSSEDIFTITLPFGSRVCDLKAYVSSKIGIDSKAFKSRRTLKDGEEVFLFEQRG